ncbi:MAG TPA: CPXCG motif-containing cysteine-rich protein [Psychromonas sp.]
MNKLASHKVHCPYCGEIIELLIDCSVEQQNYIEDCEVCCCPIGVDVSIINEGQVFVNVSHENE